MRNTIQCEPRLDDSASPVARYRANLDWRIFYGVGTDVSFSTQLPPLSKFSALCKTAKLGRSREQLVLNKFCWHHFRGNVWFSREFFQQLCWETTVQCWLLEVSKWPVLADETNVAWFPVDLCFQFLHHPQQSSASCLPWVVCSWSQG